MALKQEDLDKMRLGVAFRQPISIRGLKVMVRPLSIGETVSLANETVAELEKAPPALRTTLNEATLLARKTLHLASTADVGARDAQLDELLLDRMTPEEVQFLYDQYRDVVDIANPALENHPASEVAELVENLKKNPSALTQLSRLQFLALARFFLTSDDSPTAK